MNGTSLIREIHHYFLNEIFNDWKLNSNEYKKDAGYSEYVKEIKELFKILDIEETQNDLTRDQQEKFTTLIEGYLTGKGATTDRTLPIDKDPIKTFLQFIPEKYNSFADIGFIDSKGRLVNPIFDKETIDFFNRWFESELQIDHQITIAPFQYDFVNRCRIEKIF